MRQNVQINNSTVTMAIPQDLLSVIRNKIGNPRGYGHDDLAFINYKVGPYRG